MSIGRWASILICALLAGAAGTVAAPGSTRAECTHDDDWPLFREGAPSAPVVIAGRVRGAVPDRRTGEGVDHFTLHVEEVLRGRAPASLRVDGAAASRGCIPSRLSVRDGDRIVIAFGPARTGVSGPIASVAFLSEPPRSEDGGYPLMPRMQRLSLPHVRQILELPSADLVFFTAEDGRHGRELWRTDGTAGGTTLVRDIRPGGSSEPRELTVAGGRLFFTADDGIHGRELWTSDGTALGTRLASDTRLGPRSSNPRWLTAYGNDLLFGADDGVHGRELWMWQDDPATARLVRDLRRPGGASPGADPRDIVAWPWVAWLSADDGIHGRELWTLLGHGSDHQLRLDDIWPDAPGSRPRDPVLVDRGPFQGPFFLADDGTTGAQAWRTDPARIAELDLAATGDLGTFLGLRDVLLSVAPTPGGGQQLVVSRWVRPASVSTAGGIPGGEGDVQGHGETAVLGVTRPGETAAAIVGPVALDRRHAILGVTHADGTGTLWVTDGMPAGTHPLAPVDDGPVATSLRAIGGRVFVATVDPDDSDGELWVTDGPTAALDVVADIDPAGDAGVRSITGYHGNAVFVADDGAHGAEPWASDGTPRGTGLVLDVRPGPRGSEPRDLTAMIFARVPSDHSTPPWATP